MGVARKFFFERDFFSHHEDLVGSFFESSTSDRTIPIKKKTITAFFNKEFAMDTPLLVGCDLHSIATNANRQDVYLSLDEAVQALVADDDTPSFADLEKDFAEFYGKITSAKS